ncbi:MFS transporter [Luteitalea sp. TBR-22]|uniref:NTP/NDP exchange transporter n=1 Tax=Luteitalea sp. TBR-22 TaxID=2802971 RepID=UPI001AFB1853|nr:MFS transporter [Luteitalea sp. TBR-22]BCS34009.1 MFS transporter [Luteitalea sp. TBR-22]
MAASPSLPTPVSRLALLTGVTRDERSALAWSFLYFFSLLCAYGLLRPLREEMGVRHGVNRLQWLFSGTFLCMLLAQPLYGALVSRFERRVFLPVVYGFFIACLLVFYAVFRLDRGMTVAVPAFFIWVSVFNLFVVSVFWSFMSDIFTTDQAKRLYGIIAAGGTCGALAGPALTALLVQEVGVPQLMLISALLLGGALVAIVRLLPWATARRGADRAIGGTVLAGARLVTASPFLRAIAGLLLLYVTVNTILYYQQAAVVAAAFTDSASRAAYFARIDFAVNALTVVTQVVVTRVLLTRFGVTPLLMLSPLVVALGFAWLAATPGPLLLASIQVVHRAGNFSLIAPARESLFTRVDRESRYKAKAFIDTAIYRGGDLVVGWCMAAVAARKLPLGEVALIGLAVASIWALLGWRVGRTHDAHLAAAAPQPASATSPAVS